jgi:hypothetical protein
MASQYVDWDASWTAVHYSSGTDWTDVDIANGADLTSDSMSLDSKISCEISVTVVEDNTGACTGDVYIYLLRDVNGTNFEDYTEHDDNDSPRNVGVIDATQNKTRRRTFTVRADEVSSFKIAVENSSGQTLTTTVKVRYAVMATA